MNHRSIHSLTYFFLFLIILQFLPLVASAITPDSSVNFAAADTFYPDTAVSQMYHANIDPQWIAGDAFWYMDAGKDTTMFFLVNVSQNVRKRLLDTDRFTASLRNVSGTPVDPAHLPVDNIRLSPDMGYITFDAFGKQWTCDLSVYQMTETTLPPEIQAGVPSPDYQSVAYVNGTNLYLYDARTKHSVPLTRDGTENYFYGKRSDTIRDPVTESLLNSSPEAYLSWSPDGSKIQTFKVDQRNVSPLWLLDQAPGIGDRPVLYSYRYAMPGDTWVPMYEPVIINVTTQKIVPVKGKSQPEVSMMDTDTDVLQWWNSTGSTAYSLYIERGEKTLRLLKTQSESGDVQEILNETGGAYIESSLDYASTPNIAILEKTGDILWFSERDGWGHLYRYNSNGTFLNQVTSGPWVVRTIVGVDEDTSTIYFTGSGREQGNPYYQYLYRVHTDGTGLELLTPGEADHTISLSPDKQSFVDTFSRVDLPAVTDLKSINGTLLMHIAATDASALTSQGWVPPERVSFKARDGVTDLYGLIIKPTNFDNTKKYPVIDLVYPGPYRTVTETDFPSDLSWESKTYWTGQMLAELGYVVVTMDGLGTAYRSKAFHNVSYGNLADCGLPDHITGLQQLGARYPYMDISRVGIYGKSAGGFATAQALLTWPEFFSVGVAASGNHDSRLYGSYWGEKYEGYPKGNYTEQITPEKAGNLTGSLLLLTGDIDDNVHPSMTMQLANALEVAGKNFDMFVFTNKNHDLNYDPYYLHMVMRYFKEHLIT